MEPRKLTSADIDKVRDIEGFPIATDEAIIELSDAPYYTACPNPFIEEFIAENGTPYDEETDAYHRSPYAADVSVGKSGAIYNAHTYHTKVPPLAIQKYIEHYTNPGDVIYDAFAGSGMTGVACAMASGYIPEDNRLFEYETRTKRYCVLNDISPAASFIARGYNTSADQNAAANAAQAILEQMYEDIGWAYETAHYSDGVVVGYGTISYVVWSDVLMCPECGEEHSYYSIGINKKTGHKISGPLTCPACGYRDNAKTFPRSREIAVAFSGSGAREEIKEVPVLIEYVYQGNKYTKTPDSHDYEILERIKKEKIDYWYPTVEVPDGFNTSQPKKSHLIMNLDQFYWKRSLLSFSYAWSKVQSIEDTGVRNALLFWLDSVAVGFTKMNRYFSSSFSQVNRYLKGTLYIAPVRSEVSPWYALKGKVSMLTKLIPNRSCIISCSSSERSRIPDDSIDYIFIDPPFGSNIMYSDLNIIWESWLRVSTQSDSEAIVNETADKDEAFYASKLAAVLKDCYRVLKPKRWITIEFHNSKNTIWNIIQHAINQAGFIIADVRVLDKKIQTMKQYSTTNSVDKDLIISAYKPSTGFTTSLLEMSGTEESAWAFVTQHLESLPIAVQNGNEIQILDERRPELLFDRMIAYHIMRGLPVPIDSSDFYSGLGDRFLNRDGMYFTSRQAAEYDEIRSRSEIETLQFSLFVSNEKTAISWLTSQLLERPQTYAEIQPKFMQEVKKVDRYEAMPELADLLAENFLQDDKGSWYVPDTKKEGDIAKLREKSLLREFDGYLKSKGKLKLFRSEAIRVGFSHLWKDKNYQAIVDLANRLPAATIQEDPNLLMYYDISLSRVG